MYEIEEKNTAEKNHFGDWIKNVPVGEYAEVRKRILSDCKITEQVFRHWKCGNSKVPVLAQPFINEIAGKNIFNEENETV